MAANGVDVEDIETWERLAQLIGEHADGSWIFRGVSNEEYELVPKVARAEYLRDWRDEDARRAFSVETEQNALNIFKRAARPYLQYTPESDLDWLAIAQHHGMPTRLLDWTESLLVAAYFAVEAAGRNARGEQVDAVIYAVSGLGLVSDAEARDPFHAVKQLKAFKPPHIAARIPAQRSVFTVHPDPRVAVANDTLKAWRIRSAHCFQMKWILDACAVNQGSLFPGLDGLAANILWRYKWNKLAPTA